MDDMTVEQVAAELGMSVQGVRHRIRKGYINGQRIGARLWVVSRAEVNRVKTLPPPKPGPKKRADHD